MKNEELRKILINYSNGKDLLLGVKDENLINEIKKITNKDLLEKRANIINVPYELKDEMMKIGIIWNSSLSLWCLLKGVDIDLANNYLNQLKNEIIDKS